MSRNRAKSVIEDTRLCPNRSINVKRTVVEVSAVIFSSIILCFLAFYNGYPIVFNNDTAMYIENAFSGIVPSDRPKLYALFLRFTSLGHSLWFVIYAQALIVSTIILLYFRLFKIHKSYLLWYILFICFVSFLMSASFEVSWLMPDIFTPISILSLGLILIDGGRSWSRDLFVSLTYIFSLGVHNSHLYICIVILIVILVAFFIKPLQHFYISIRLGMTKIICGCLLTFAGFLFMGFIQYYFDSEFKTSRGGHVFIISNLIEMGIVDIYLDENCDIRSFKLCQYKGSLPNNFLWNENSPIKKTGGWEVNKQEYSTIVKDIVTTPKYLRLVVYKSLIYTVKQLFNFDIVDIWIPSERVNYIINKHYAHEFSAHANTRESKDTLKVSKLNSAQNMVVGISILLIIALSKLNLFRTKAGSILIFLLLGIIVNAWVCSTFSGVFPRYQSRVVWMIPLPIFLFLLEMKSEKKRTMLIDSDEANSKTW